jgi:hypothetical protein
VGSHHACSPYMCLMLTDRPGAAAAALSSSIYELPLLMNLQPHLTPPPSLCVCVGCHWGCVSPGAGGGGGAGDAGTWGAAGAGDVLQHPGGLLREAPGGKDGGGRTGVACRNTEDVSSGTERGLWGSCCRFEVGPS